MKNFKDDFFEKGYVSKLPVLNRLKANSIFKDYEDFIKSKIDKASLIEHKTKSHLYFPWANELIHNNEILDHVEKVIGPNFFCWNSVIFHKHPNSSTFVSMHQDQNYWGIIHDKALSVQLAITYSKINNGCLRILPGSHKNNYSHEDLVVKDNLLARGQSISENELDNNKFLDVELDAGQCVLFHGNLVHGSKPNLSNDHRLCFTMRFLTTDNKIKKNLYYNYATLVRGTDQFNYFQKEKSLKDQNIEELRQQHKEIVISQIEKYVKLKFKNKIITKIIMFFLKNKVLRSIYYEVIKKN